jgi:hypothetical protein
MKNILTLIAGALLFTACSSPKYAYYFDKYDYNSGRKSAVSKVEVPSQTETSPLSVTPETLTASASVTPEPATVHPNLEVAKKEAAEKLASMSKREKKEFKQELKKYIKSVKKADSGKGVHATKVWDHDLKMAVIFGVIAVVLTALYGVSPVFWILGIVSLVVAVVFLIQWLSRQ